MEGNEDCFPKRLYQTAHFQFNSKLGQIKFRGFLGQRDIATVITISHTNGQFYVVHLGDEGFLHQS